MALGSRIQGSRPKPLTLWPAQQCSQEEPKGSIEVDKPVDLVILSGNPMTVPQRQLADLKVLETINESVSIYRCPESSSAISSPALFELTLHGSYDADHGIPGVGDVHGAPAWSASASARFSSSAARRPGRCASWCRDN